VKSADNYRFGPLPESVAAPAGSAWRWVHIAVAALAMVATLPGRTHGLGLITEPLLQDLRLDRLDFAAINLWATLLGAAFCLPCGWLLDRLGARLTLTVVAGALGAVVMLMSGLQGGSGRQTALLIEMFVLVLLTRGLGQSALSVVSLALMGKAAGRRAGFAVGVYSFLVAVGFMTAFGVVKKAVEDWDADWRSLWAGIGLALLLFAQVGWLVMRPPRAGADRGETADLGEARPGESGGLSLGQTMRTPAFWVFALATSLYGLIASGISLFNQSILQERGFDRGVFLTITMLTPLIGLASNLATGWLATRWPMRRLLAVAMLILTGSLLALPLVETLLHVYLYAAALGVAGGMVTVIFFGVWGPTFGTAHLGKIQGAAQMLTVLASAGGPLLLALSRHHWGSYVPMFQLAAGASALLGLAAWWVPAPRAADAGARATA
jgi:MFS family permease